MGLAMSREFDPYEKWLGVSREERPISCYALLGLEPFESDLDKIERSAKIRIAALEEKRKGPHGEHVDKVVKRLRQAAQLLLDPDQKAKYDQKLLAAVAGPRAPGSEDDTTDLQDQTREVVVAKPPAANFPAAPPAKAKAGPPAAAPVAKAVPAKAVPAKAIPAQAAPAGAVPARPVVPGRPAQVAPSTPSGFFRGLGGPGSWIGGRGAGAAAAGSSVGPASSVGIGGISTTVAPRKKPASVMPLVGGGIGLVALAIAAAWVVTSSGSPKTVADAAPKAAKGEGNQKAATPAAAEPLDDPLASPAAKRNARAAAAASAPAASAEAPAGADAARTLGAPGANAVTEPAAPAEPDDVEWAVKADPATGDVKPLTSDLVAPARPSGPVRTAAVDFAGQWLAVVVDKTGEVQTWDLSTAKSGGFKPKSPVEQLGWLPGGKLLLWTEKGQLLTVDPNSGEVQKEWNVPLQVPGAEAMPERGIAVSPGGRFFAIYRNGIRFYDAEDGRLAGVWPVPEGCTVAAMGFEPDGKKLLFIGQQLVGERIYRKCELDLATGKTNWEAASHFHGDLVGEGVNGLLYLRPGSYTSFLAVGNRFLLRADDGRVAGLSSRSVPEWLIPLDGGEVLWGNAAGTQVSSWNLDKITAACRSFDRSGSTRQVSPNQPIKVQTSVAAAPVSTPSKLEAAVSKAVDARLDAEGMKRADSAEATLSFTVTERGGPQTRKVQVWTPGGGKVERQLAKPIATISASIDFSIISAEGKPLHKSRRNLLPTEVVLTPAQFEAGTSDAYLEAYLSAVSEAISGANLPYFAADDITAVRFLPEELTLSKKAAEEEEAK